MKELDGLKTALGDLREADAGRIALAVDFVERLVAVAEAADEYDRSHTMGGHDEIDAARALHAALTALRSSPHGGEGGAS